MVAFKDLNIALLSPSLPPSLPLFEGGTPSTAAETGGEGGGERGPPGCQGETEGAESAVAAALRATSGGKETPLPRELWLTITHSLVHTYIHMERCLY